MAAPALSKAAQRRQRELAAALTTLKKRALWRQGLDLLQKASKQQITPSLLSFGTALGLAAAAHRWREALGLLRQVEASSQRPDNVCLNAALHALERGRQWEAALQLFHSYKERSVDTDTVAQCTAMSALACGQQQSKVLRMVDDFRVAGQLEEERPLAVAMASLAALQQWAIALQLWQEVAMEEEGKETEGEEEEQEDQKRKHLGSVAAGKARWGIGDGEGDGRDEGRDHWHVEPGAAAALTRPHGSGRSLLAVTSLLSALESGGQWQRALGLVESLPKLALEPDVVAYNSLLSSFEKGQQWQRALATFHELRTRFTTGLDPITFNATISACEKGRQWRLALCFLDLMPDHAVAPTTTTFNALTTACASRAEWQRCVQLLEEMRRRDLELNVLSHNASIHSAAQAQRWPQALEGFAVMRALRLHTDEVTFSVVIGACRHSQAWPQALAVVEDIRRAQLDLGSAGLTEALHAFHEASQWERALLLLKEAPGDLRTLQAVGQAAASCQKSRKWTLSLHLLEDSWNEPLRDECTVAFIAVATVRAQERCLQPRSLVRLVQLLQDSSEDWAHGRIQATHRVLIKLAFSFVSVLKPRDRWPESSERSFDKFLLRPLYSYLMASSTSKKFDEPGDDHYHIRGIMEVGEITGLSGMTMEVVDRAGWSWSEESSEQTASAARRLVVEGLAGHALLPDRPQSTSILAYLDFRLATPRCKVIEGGPSEVGPGRDRPVLTLTDSSRL